MKIPPKDEKYIPWGLYCHCLFPDQDPKPPRYVMKSLPCPYLEFKQDKPEQMFGYCHFLEAGDWEENGTMLLWDSCKECGVKYDDEDEDHYDENDNLTETGSQKLAKWLENMLPLLENDDEAKPMVVQWLDDLKTQKEK